MLLNEGLTHIRSQKDPWLHLCESFTLNLIHVQHVILWV